MIATLLGAQYRFLIKTNNKLQQIQIANNNTHPKTMIDWKEDSN